MRLEKNVNKKNYSLNFFFSPTSETILTRFSLSLSYTQSRQAVTRQTASKWIPLERQTVSNAQTGSSTNLI